MRFLTLIVLLFSLSIQSGWSQTTCSALGQNPETAFPVCGTAVFHQSSVAICGDRTVTSRCTDANFTDKNPYWYKFTCFASGTLGFLIQPMVASDDYDWQLFDVTGKSPSAVYTDVSTFVACNWSGDPGNTGASTAGTSLIRCAGPGVPLFSSMPTLLVGHEYLLLISHFTNTQSGYDLSFGGGTAVITDPTPPHLESASILCDGSTIDILLNKPMRCNSLSANGSEFTISHPTIQVIAAEGDNCSHSFDVTRVRLTLSAPLPPGNYMVTIQNGSDGNTLKDLCDNTIPVNEQVPLTVIPVMPTPMDSLTTPKCAADELEVVFPRKIKCSSIAANGSDFRLTGSYPITIASATGICDNNGMTTKIKIRLSAPLYRGGNFTLHLQRSADDGNTVLDECGRETPPGATLNFIMKDTVSAEFSFIVNAGCVLDTVNYIHNGQHGVNYWNWVFDTFRISNIPTPSIMYSTVTDKNTRLIVSNGFCADTAAKIIQLPQRIKAAIAGAEFVCPDERIIFTSASSGNVQQWLWDFGNGQTYSGPNPPAQSYPNSNNTSTIPIKLTVKDSRGCDDVSVLLLTVANNCFIAVPSAFTPNGDGLNDYLYPLNAYKATNLKFAVYNRLGQQVFYTEDWMRRWDGTYKGMPADMGTYVYMLQYTDAETGKIIYQKGAVTLIR